MALQVWLPLNRDIRDIGLSNTNPINNGATINDSGIFEKCYEFNSSKTIYITNFNLSSTEFSVSCWVNIVSSIGGGSAEYIVCLNNNNYSGDMQFAIFHRTRTLTVIVNNTEYTVQALDLNAWYHIVLTFSNKIAKIYINGTLVNTRTISSNAYTGHNLNIGSRSSANDGSTHAYYANVLVNDVRVYDNALTEKDVKRIYQKKMFDLVTYSGIKNVLFDRSGLMLMPLVNNGAVFKGNSLYFNNQAKLRPKNGNVGFSQASCGTLSIWFSMTAAPTRYNMLYIDSTSKFAVGFLNSSSFIVTCNNSALATFSSSGIKYDGTLNNIIVSYNTSKAPQFCLINGIQVSTVSTNNWSETSGLTIGSRMYNDAGSYFIGKINQVQVFNSQFTAEDALKLYNDERHMFLPDEYEELEYIKSTGTQWIDTQYIPNANTKLIVKFKQEQAQTNTTYYPISCVRSDDNKLLLECFIRQTNTWAYSVAGNEYVGTLESATNMLNVEMSLTKFSINGTTIRTASTVTVNNTTRKLFLFAYNKDGGPDTTRYMSCNLYSAKVYETNDGIDTLIMNFIPAKRKSDNVIGLYDMISNHFFTNSGTGSFTGA